MDEGKKPEPPEKLKTLREDLYTRGELGHTHSEHRGEKFQRPEYHVKDDWTVERINSPEIMAASSMTKHMRQRTSPLRFVLAISIVFFLLSAVVAAYVFYSEVNVISTDHVNISAVLPPSIRGGEVLTFRVSIENNNTVDLESADLNVEFPPGTKKPLDLSADFTRHQESIGVIPENGSVVREISAVFFGEENTPKKIIISVDYRTKDSNALLHKEKEYDILLTDSPISMSIKGLAEIQSGQDLEFVVDLVSNSKTSVENILLKVEYPFGFEFKSGVPKPTFGKNIWKIGILKPTGKTTLRIKGNIVGQNEEERIFNFAVGVQDKKNEKIIGTTFLDLPHTTRIKRPFIGVDIALDGNRSLEYVTRAGSSVRADVFFSNNLPTRIADSVIEVKLNGMLFEPQTVASDSGFYRSSDSVIVWDQTGTPKLGVLEAGSNNNVSFSFGLTPTASVIGGGIRNPEMTFAVSVRGKRTSETSVPEEIVAGAIGKIKLATEVNFNSQSSRVAGLIANHGPIPPKVGQETTYTVHWLVTNTSNTVTGGEVKAILPSYAKWLGVVSPPNELVDFQPVGGVIIWDVGEVKPYSGFTGQPREVAFQVAITPSLSQVGQSPVLLKEAVFTGTDEFTAIPIKISRPGVTTDTNADPGYNPDSGAVVL